MLKNAILSSVFALTSVLGFAGGHDHGGCCKGAADSCCKKDAACCKKDAECCKTENCCEKKAPCCGEKKECCTKA
jgi:hypothetical protein